MKDKKKVRITMSSRSIDGEHWIYPHIGLIVWLEDILQTTKIESPIAVDRQIDR